MTSDNTPIDLDALDGMIKWHDAHQWRSQGPVGVLLMAARAYLALKRQEPTQQDRDEALVEYESKRWMANGGVFMLPELSRKSDATIRHLLKGNSQ